MNRRKNCPRQDLHVHLAAESDTGWWPATPARRSVAGPSGTDEPGRVPGQTERRSASISKRLGSRGGAARRTITLPRPAFLAA